MVRHHRGRIGSPSLVGTEP